MKRILKIVMPVFLVIVSMSIIEADEVKAGNEQKNADCTKIWTSDVKMLSLISRGGGNLIEIYIDLKFKKITKIITDYGDAVPYKRALYRDLSSTEILKLNEIAEPLCLSEITASRGPAPGGSWYYEVYYKPKLGVGSLIPQPSKILSREEGVDQGTTYYILNAEQSKLLADFIDSLALSIE